jgi:cytoskeleton protein RodZ
MAKQMWKIRPAVASGSAASDVAQDDRDVGGPKTTGRLLRTTREAVGFELRDVAEALRIRYPYLDAIENDRFDDLPGSTYAVGFVRAYSEHLGLEGSEVVARFKLETGALNYKPQLVFPVPPVEARVPSGAVLLIGVFLAVLAYSSWIYVSSQGQTFGSIIPEFQRRIAMLTGDGNSVSPSKSETPITPTFTTQASTTQALPVKEVPESVQVSTAGANTPAERELDSSESQTAEAALDAVATGGLPLSTSINGGLKTPADAEDATSGAASAVTPAVPDSGNAVEAGLEQSTEIVGLPTLPQDLPPDLPQSDQTQEPVVYGADNADARITIQALGDSWVEIKDVDDELLLTRVLQTGDSFLVPNRLGLTMMTGNAGALRITVDGEPVQSIGPRGSVRRDVKLEPELLKNNTAHNL